MLVLAQNHHLGPEPHNHLDTVHPNSKIQVLEFKLATLSAVNQTKSIPLSLMLLLVFILLTTVSTKLII